MAPINSGPVRLWVLVFAAYSLIALSRAGPFVPDWCGMPIITGTGWAAAVACN